MDSKNRTDFLPLVFSIIVLILLACVFWLGDDESIWWIFLGFVILLCPMIHLFMHQGHHHDDKDD